MSVNDLRELSVQELQNKIVDLKKELMESRFALATSQIEDTSIFKKIKKEIAQANTVLTEKLNKLNLKAELCLDRDAAQEIILKADKVQDKLVSL